MRTRIISGIIGVVLCSGAVAVSAPPASADPAPVPPPTGGVVVVGVGDVIKFLHFPHAPCIDCW